MAEFLIKAQDAPVPDSSGKWYAALIVNVQEDGHEWGGQEGPPKFYILKVPGLLKADAEQYMQEWRHNVSSSIVNSNAAQDTYRIRIDSNMVSTSGKNAFIRAQVEEFFSNWNASIIQVKSNSITFDISVFDAITSNGFWGADVSAVVFVETDYNQPSGDHLIQVQSSPYTLQQMQNIVEFRGGSVVPPDSFIMNRNAARTRLLEDIKEKLDRISYARRRWYVTATGMDALNAAGGVITITPAQLLNNVSDGLAD